MNDHGLIYACILDGRGGARQIGWPEIDAWRPADGPIWIHLDFSCSTARDWIAQRSGMDEVAAQALVSDETRPRATNLGDATLISLRGVNLNPGSEPEDMVSIRIWIEKNRIVSARRRKLLSEGDVIDALHAHNGPRTTGGLIAGFIGHLIHRMQGAIDDLEDRSAQVEEDLFSGENRDLRGAIADVRRETILLRRYLAPQREAMTRLHMDEHAWIGSKDRMNLRESSDQLARYIEDLDSIRERAMVTHEELVNRLSEQMNSRIYLLSLVAALFLPLSFFTGLLGINVGGIPGSSYKGAFAIVVIILLAIIAGQFMFFKLRKWL